MGIIALTPVSATAACSGASAAASSRARMRVPSPRARMTAFVTTVDSAECDVSTSRCFLGSDERPLLLVVIGDRTASGPQPREHANEADRADDEEHEPHAPLRRLAVQEAPRAEERRVDEDASQHPAEERL